jgi:hypothetical protein
MKRYRVEILTNTSSIWEPVCYTDSLPVARRYAVSLRYSDEIEATRVVDQRTEQVECYDPPDARPGRVDF